MKVKCFDSDTNLECSICSNIYHVIDRNSYSNNKVLIYCEYCIESLAILDTNYYDLYDNLDNNNTDTDDIIYDLMYINHIINVDNINDELDYNNIKIIQIIIII